MSFLKIIVCLIIKLFVRQLSLCKTQLMAKFIENSIVIAADALRVWDALVNPAKTKVYMFGCEAVSDWLPGSALQWRGEYNGQAMVFVTGHVVSLQPGEKLVYTVFDPNGTIPDLPENYLTVTYLLDDTDGSTRLSVTQGDYDTVGDGERRYAESYNNGEGWQPILEQIKILVEAA
jgi:uncharacterized protein YndB with AHSA1/START domain